MPRLYHEIKVVNPKTKVENTIPLETSPTRQNLKSYLLNEGFSNKKLVVPQSTTLEADTAFLIKPVTNVDGKVHNETYLFAIDNTKIRHTL